MKILYLVTKSNWGGAQRHVYDLSVQMKEHGHDVSVALGGSGKLRERLEEAGIYTHSISSLGRDISASKDTASFGEIFSIVRHRRPHILHLHSPKAAGLGALVGRILRVPKIVFTVHGWTFNENRPIMSRLLVIFFSWLTILLCHKVIVLSEREYAQALHFPWAKGKIELIPLGVKPPTFISVEGAKTAIAKLIGLAPSEASKKILIGTIAELHRNKGLNYLLDAMATVVREHPQAVLVIIGDGEEKAALHMQIKEKGLEGKVHLAGYLDHASEYLKAFSIFVLPSIKEGLPYAIFEAGCASLPVVSTTVGGIPEMVEDMKSGILIQPKNSRELSHAISFVIEHPSECKKYGTALREKVLREFSMEKMVASVEDLYKDSN